MVRRYEYMNDVTAFGRLGDDMFAYVLMLNLGDDVPPRPYHVGLATNLAAMLGRARYVVWHNMEFNRPALVFVLGLVKKNVAEQALADLKFQLLAEGYLLAGNGVPNAQLVTRFKRYDLLRYAQREHDALLLPRWRQKWLNSRVAAGEPEGARHGAAQGVSKREVAAYLARHPLGDKDLQALLLRLADAYDGRSGEARLVLSEVELRLLERPQFVSLFGAYWNRVVAAADGATVFTLNGSFVARVRADTARVRQS